MKYVVFFFAIVLFVSCSSIRVYSDFDNSVDFSQYKTYAFFKPQIDKVDISDLDKRRILKAIDNELSSKGLSKSETPDILIGFTTAIGAGVGAGVSIRGFGDLQTIL